MRRCGQVKAWRWPLYIDASGCIAWATDGEKLSRLCGRGVYMLDLYSSDERAGVRWKKWRVFV